MKFSTTCIAFIACLVAAAPTSPATSIPKSAVVVDLMAHEHEIMMAFIDTETEERGFAVLDLEKAFENGLVTIHPAEEEASESKDGAKTKRFWEQDERLRNSAWSFEKMQARWANRNRG